MTDREVMQQALDAWDDPMKDLKDLCVAMDAIRTALEQQAEPVGEVIDERGEVDYISYVPPVGTALYTTPPQRQWVGLTDEEITELRLKNFDAVATNYESYRAIEAKLKEKNDNKSEQPASNP